jgi:hypothetical protein
MVGCSERYRSIPPVGCHDLAGRRIMAALSPSAPSLTVAEVLRIAHQDAQRVYRDLSCFKITLTPCLDGWHVDYELTDALSAGGGPHCVIQPDTGDILARRYEQ